jgi:hypothetical protein
LAGTTEVGAGTAVGAAVGDAAELLVGAGDAEEDGATLVGADGTGVGVVTAGALGAGEAVTVVVGDFDGDDVTPAVNGVTENATDARTNPATSPSVFFLDGPWTVTTVMVCDPATACGTVTCDLNFP